jgi:hypothetical protein
MDWRALLRHGASWIGLIKPLCVECGVRPALQGKGSRCDSCATAALLAAMAEPDTCPECGAQAVIPLDRPFTCPQCGWDEGAQDGEAQEQ